MAREGMVGSPGTPLHHQASILHQAASQWGDLSPYSLICMVSQVVLVVKNLPASARCERPWFHPWAGKIPWRRKWQHAPVFLPGKFHRQRSLVGYSPSESDTTE